MKIVLWGTYDTSKPRIRILVAGLRGQGVEVAEIHKSIWEGTTDKSELRGMLKWLRFGFRLCSAYPWLIWRYLQSPGHDLVLVSYPGQLDILILRAFAWMRKKPVAFDWFISAYDTVVEDRKLLGRKNPLAWMLWAGEWLAARAADIGFMDTTAHARRMEQLFRLAPDSVGCVWVGVEENHFHPIVRQESKGNDLQVLFYGQFIPLHGIETIFEAAYMLRDEPIEWTLIGRGQEATRIRSLLAERPLPNLRWLEWVQYERLNEWIARADVCLGIFGTSDKAASVIPNKVFQVVASGLPLVTRDSPAIRELLVDAPPCVHLVPAGDARALAAAIRDCQRSVRKLHAPCHVEAASRINSRAVAQQFRATVQTRFHMHGQTT